MKIWTCAGFNGHYPVGTAAIVRAETVSDAVRILNEELRKYGLTDDATEDMMLEFTLDNVRILCDGNY